MRHIRNIAAIALVLALAAACSGRSDDSAPTSSLVTTAAPTTSTTIAPTTAASPSTTTATTVVTTVADTLPEPEPVPPPDESRPTRAIGRIALPKLGVSEPLLSGVTMPTLNKGPGHWPGTALPGRVGNVVVAGHRVSHSRPFYDLDKLKQGDEIVFEMDGGRYVYLVRKVQIVEPDALWIVSQTPTKTATLFACHPKGSTRQRIVAFADYSPEKSTPTV